ncbi:type I restriction-modification system specificity subunit [Streptococcus anginosus 1_2_62CV]|uniref:restriction endonuclease subunit S n=1 Tax=Streptococcus anginosus TaxID=1328 RepID=UPI0001F6091E|nr:restriction endonuclease subunit S [Streptococcus anginosus]EFW08325.1 type I restriction-modification system specificity subunit [Streptococcus anginosus 1_2_62CV]
MEKEKNKERIPQLRFPEFKNTPAWKQRKLGEVAVSFSGGTPSIGNSKYYNGEIPFIRSAEINSAITELYLTEEGLKNSSAKMVNVGDILYALYGATSGEVGISKINGAINQAILAIKPYDAYNSKFIEQWLKNQKKNIIDKYLQGGQGNLSAAIVKKLLIPFPSLPEQTAIGDFFSTLDRSIALHQRELENLKNRKKSLLQKMFPKNGESVPKIRFPEFKNAPAWEQRKLGEVVSAEKKGKAKADMIGDESVYLDTEYLNGGQIVKVNAVKDTYLDDVIILWDGSQAGTLYYGFEGALGSTLKAYTISESSLFIYQQLKSRQQIIYEKYRTPNIPHVIKTFLDEFGVYIPSLPEQTAIGDFFSTLDRSIALHQRKLEHLKLRKKALLQKMFP